MPRRASGVILYAKRARNETPPAGTLVNSGWKVQGLFGDFLGTAISKKYFITAGHLAGSPGDKPFIYNGTSFQTTAFFDDPLSDLRIWKINGNFSSWSRLYTSSNEAGKVAMIFGRGTARGPEVRKGGTLKGWKWGADDSHESWGMNNITGPVSGNDDNGHSVSGTRLAWTFDRNGLKQESILSDGDSGGGVFIKEGIYWKLAGINHDVDDNFRIPGTADTFAAAIFDKGGLISDGSSISDTTIDKPAISYATRISSRMDWINAVLSGNASPNESNDQFTFNSTGVPEPGSLGLILGALALLTQRRRAA